MSTTYTLDLVSTGIVEIARTHFNGEKVEVTWLNPLAAVLQDEETVQSDSGNPLCHTVGDLRELEVPKMWDEMTTYELMDEIKSMRDERDGVSMRLKKEIVDLHEECDGWEIIVSDLKKDLWKHQLDADDKASELNHFEEKLQSEIKELKEDIKELEEQSLKSSAFWQSKANALENERFGETQLLTLEKEWTTELEEARKALSNALQDSLDREAELRQSEMILRGIVKHREEEIEIVTRREKHFLDCLKKEQKESLDLAKANMKLERKVLTMNDVVVERGDFTVTIFGEVREDGQGGFFEHNERGEDFAGGLWFDDSDFNGDKALRDYDGVYTIPVVVLEALEQEGIEVSKFYEE